MFNQLLHSGRWSSLSGGPGGGGVGRGFCRKSRQRFLPRRQSGFSAARCSQSCGRTLSAKTWQNALWVYVNSCTTTLCICFRTQLRKCDSIHPNAILMTFFFCLWDPVRKWNEKNNFLSLILLWNLLLVAVDDKCLLSPAITPLCASFDGSKKVYGRHYLDTFSQLRSLFVSLCLTLILTGKKL